MDIYSMDTEISPTAGKTTKAKLKRGFHKFRRFSQRLAIRIRRSMNPEDKTIRFDPAEFDAARPGLRLTRVPECI